MTDKAARTNTAEHGESGIKSGRAHFRPRARLLRTLGHELITNELVALQELVKNAYDADAHEVVISFENPITAGSGAVTVSDDGIGMSLDTLLGAWMERCGARRAKNFRRR